MKICTKCKEEKPISEFAKDASIKCGIRSHCKACNALDRIIYNDFNPGKTKAYNAGWRNDNQIKAKAYKPKWRADNPKKARAASAKQREKSPDKARAAVAAWAAANPESVRVKHQNRRAMKRATGKLSPNINSKLFNMQRGLCPCCGLSLGDDFHLDHKMPLALGGENIDSNMQLLRKTCNLQKGAKDPIDFMQSRGFLL